MKNVTMGDPLTTQEIYDELFNFKKSLKKLADDFGELANGIMLSLAKKPSADRPRGEWVYHEDYKLDGECCYECSECGRMYDYKMNYCGYCGADMRGDNK